MLSSLKSCLLGLRVLLVSYWARLAGGLAVGLAVTAGGLMSLDSLVSLPLSCPVFSPLLLALIPGKGEGRQLAPCIRVRFLLLSGPCPQRGVPPAHGDSAKLEGCG